MNILGQRIRNLREQENILQNDLARKIDVSNVVLSRYESGERKPDYETLWKIADCFNVNIDYLLGRIDTPRPILNSDISAFPNDPDLEQWYRKLPDLNKNQLRQLQQIWESIEHTQD